MAKGDTLKNVLESLRTNLPEADRAFTLGGCRSESGGRMGRRSLHSGSQGQRHDERRQPR